MLNKYNLIYRTQTSLSEIPNFLTHDECHKIINLATGVGLDTSEVQDPEMGMNIEPTNEETFRSWDYNRDGVIDTVEVLTLTYPTPQKNETFRSAPILCFKKIMDRIR